MTDIHELLAEVDRRHDIEAKAAKADRLELRLLATKIGLRETPAVEAFLDRYGDRPRTDEAFLVAWSEYLDDDSFLTPAQRFRAQLAQENHAD